jgi:hypothetical protein
MIHCNYLEKQKIAFQVEIGESLSLLVVRQSVTRYEIPYISYNHSLSIGLKNMTQGFQMNPPAKKKTCLTDSTLVNLLHQGYRIILPLTSF